MKDKPIKSIEEYKFHCNACYGNPSSIEGCFTDDVTTTTTSCKEDGLWGKEIQPIWNSNPLRLRPVYVPTFGAGCEHRAHQTDDNGDEVICFCSHDGNEEDTEGNCRREVCPKQQATVFGKVAEQLNKENKMENKIIKFGKMLFVEGDKVYASGAIYKLAKVKLTDSGIMMALGDDPVDVLEFTEFLKAQRPKIDDKAFYDAAIAFVQDNQAEFYEIMHRNYSMNNSDFDKAIGKLTKLAYFDDHTALADALRQAQQLWDGLLAAENLDTAYTQRAFRRDFEAGTLVDLMGKDLPEQEHIEEALDRLKDYKSKEGKQ